MYNTLPARNVDELRKFRGFSSINQIIKINTQISKLLQLDDKSSLQSKHEELKCFIIDFLNSPLISQTLGKFESQDYEEGYVSNIFQGFMESLRDQKYKEAAELCAWFGDHIDDVDLQNGWNSIAMLFLKEVLF